MSAPVGPSSVTDARGTLGCCLNQAEVWDRCFSRKIASLSGNGTCVQWDRGLDVVSNGSVTVGREADCCDKLPLIEPWRHWLVIYRCGVQVWAGPILRLEFTTDGTTVRARDPLAWFERREIRDDLALTGNIVTDIAAGLINYGLAPLPGEAEDDATCMAGWVDYYPGDYSAYSYTWDGNQTTVGAELRNLAGGTLNFTALGRRVLVWSALALGRTAMVQDKHLLGEVTVIKDGYGMANRAGVVGKSVESSCAVDDSYYGRLETVVRDDSITDVPTARQVACVTATAAQRPTITLDVPDGVRLDPAAPVTIDELVPGVVMPFWSDSTCLTVNQDMVLTKVAVQSGCGDDADGEEQVTITVGPRSILAEGAATASGGSF